VLLRAVTEAAAAGRPLAVVFVLDPSLTAPSGPNRLAYLLRTLRSLRQDGLPLVVRTGDPARELVELARRTGATTVRATAEFTPTGIARDRRVGAALAAAGVTLETAASPYAAEPGTVASGAGTGFRVFTAFHRVWLEAVRDLVPFPALDPRQPDVRWADVEPGDIPGDPAGVAPGLPEAGEHAAWARWASFRDHHLDGYATVRDVPGMDATSRLSADLKYGVVHPRSLLPELRTARLRSGPWVFRSELGWREFYADVLFRRPETRTRAVDPMMESMAVDTGPEADRRFDAWCEGRTGFPFIDAGMRQLLAEGWMHNRVRMAVASFLVKDLHLDWRRGAAHFMEHLVDGDIASNTHGWQWVAGTGTDAAPYFRVFNPVTQGRRYDPEGVYVRRWVPELAAVTGDVHQPGANAGGRPGAAAYPGPIVDHAAERLEALARHREVRGRR
jgi:deoxyribodipyrimidine photo-lyase